MLKTVQATIEEDGRVFFSENVNIVFPRKALITFLDEESELDVTEDNAHFLSEDSLSKEWLLEEENAAWNTL